MKKDIITSKLRPSKKQGLDEVAQRRVVNIQGEKCSWIDLQNPDRLSCNNSSGGSKTFS